MFHHSNTGRPGRRTEFLFSRLSTYLRPTSNVPTTSLLLTPTTTLTPSLRTVSLEPTYPFLRFRITPNRYLPLLPKFPDVPSSLQLFIHTFLLPSLFYSMYPSVSHGSSICTVCHQGPLSFQVPHKYLTHWVQFSSRGFNFSSLCPICTGIPFTLLTLYNSFILRYFSHPYKNLKSSNSCNKLHQHYKNSYSFEILID